MYVKKEKKIFYFLEPTQLAGQQVRKKSLWPPALRPVLLVISTILRYSVSLITPEVTIESPLWSQTQLMQNPKNALR